MKSNLIIFIVEDNLLYLKALEFSIKNQFEDVTIYPFINGDDCIKRMNLMPHLIILDYNISEIENGIDILKRIIEINKDAPVVMLSDQDSVQVGLTSIDKGAFDYVIKNAGGFTRINNIISNL